jgi:GNAT superfamily N-acetyltransferase
MHKFGVDFMIIVRQIELNKSQSEQVLDLLELGFNERFSLEWLTWKYVKNPLLNGNPPFAFAAFQEGSNKIVGIMSYIPSDININGKLIRGVQVCDLVVSPDYRNKGIFTLLVKESTKKLIDNGIKLILSFPNFNSMPGFLKQGYIKVGLLDEQYTFNKMSQVIKKNKKNLLYRIGSEIFDFLVPDVKKVTDKIESIENKEIVISKNKKFTEEYSALLQCRDIDRAKVEKNIEYLNWRYKKRTDKEYTIWTASKNNKPVAYLVTTIINNSSFKQGQIVDFQYTHIEDIYALLNKSMKSLLYEEECNLISTWAFTDKELFLALNKLGFISKSKFPFRYVINERQFLIKILDRSISEKIMSMENWSIRASDKDIY